MYPLLLTPHQEAANAVEECRYTKQITKKGKTHMKPEKGSVISVWYTGMRGLKLKQLRGVYGEGYMGTRGGLYGNKGSISQSSLFEIISSNTALFLLLACNVN